MVQIHGKNMHTLIAEKSGSALEERLIIFDRGHPAQTSRAACGTETVSSSEFPCRAKAVLQCMSALRPLQEGLIHEEKDLQEGPHDAYTH
jgi:hypothetical protein